MKKTIFCILLTIAASSFVCFSQDKTRDVINLKNGGITKGDIIEKTTESAKIRTADGSVFVYPMSEISSIGQENYSLPSIFNGRGPSTGYRGFLDILYNKYIFGSGDSFGFETTHGYQIKNWLFIGAGAGFYYLYDKYDNYCLIPIYGDIRFDFLNHSISPFFDLKIGYNINTATKENYNKTCGLLLSPSIGARIATKSRIAFNVSIGYNARQCIYPSGRLSNVFEGCAEVAFRVGIEF